MHVCLHYDIHDCEPASQSRYLGQFSDMAGQYVSKEQMEVLVSYFENIADLNIPVRESGHIWCNLQLCSKFQPYRSPQDYETRCTHPKLPEAQRRLWATTQQCESLNIEMEGGEGVHHVKIAPLKPLWRCAEKAIDRLDDYAGTPVYLTDIVSGQLLFRSIYAMHAAVEALSRYPSVVVTRVRDRFADPANGGWSDIIVNFYHEDDPNQHCCEVQFVLKDLVLLRGHDLGGEDDYIKFRSCYEVCSTCLAHLGTPCSVCTSLACRANGTHS